MTTQRDKVAKAISAARGHAHPGLHYIEHLADAAIAAHLAALNADGYVVIQLPEVAHKGPHDTDAKPAVRLDIPHRDGCNRQLIVIDETYLRRHRDLTLVQSRDALGRRHPHSWRNWLTLICNDIECPAVVLVRCDAIEAIATAGTR